MKKLLALALAGTFVFAGCSITSKEDYKKSTKTASSVESPVDFVKAQERTVLEYDAEVDQPSDEEIKDMLHMAMEAPSGLNQQPYWVTAIKDYDTQMDLALTPETVPEKSTVMFIYSTPEGEDPSMVDIGISYAYLQFMGQAYGYGSHIYMQPARMLAEEGDFEKYGIPEGYEPQAFVLVGESVKKDGESAATEHSRDENYNIVD